MDDDLLVALANATRQCVDVKLKPLLDRLASLEKAQPAPEQQLLRDLALETKKAIENATDPLLERIAVLEAKQANFRYCGVFEAGRKYMSGNFVTCGGGVWHCNLETSTRPGDGGDQWTLAVKQGRDGRDGTR